MAIAIEIADRDIDGMGTRVVVDGGAETTHSIPDEDRDIVRAVIRHCKVLFAIAVEISDGYRIRKTACWEIAHRTETAVAVAPQDRQVIRPDIGNSEVLL